MPGQGYPAAGYLGCRSTQGQRFEQAQPLLQSGEQHFWGHGSYEDRVEPTPYQPELETFSPSTQGFELQPTAAARRTARASRFTGGPFQEKAVHPGSGACLGFLDTKNA